MTSPQERTARPGPHAAPGAAATSRRVLHSQTFRLGYADTDPAGILYYAAWLPWMERTQTEWFYLNDLGQDTLAGRFGFWTVTVHAECDYLVPVGLHDEIRLELRLGEMGHSSFVTEHTMVRTADERLVGRGRITLVTVDPAGTSVPVPQLLRDRLAAASGTAARVGSANSSGASGSAGDCGGAGETGG